MVEGTADERDPCAPVEVAGTVAAMLATLAPRVVRLAFDADAVANPAVARALRDAAAGIRVAGFECEVETWNAN